MTKQTNAENLKDMVINLGSKPKGRTTAEVLDQLEDLVGAGDGNVTEGSISDEDMDSIFDD